MFDAHRIVALTAGMLSLASPARAGFTYIAQTRSITANAVSGGVTDSHSLSATTFDVFDASVSAQAFNPDTGFSGFGGATQLSRLDPLQVVAIGSWSGHRDGQTGFPSGGGTSSFDITFTLDQAADFRFEASGVINVAFVYVSAPGDWLHIRANGIYTGTLIPGTYMMGGSTSGSAGFPAGSSSFTMNLTIPSPGSATVLAAGFLCIGRRRR